MSSDNTPSINRRNNENPPQSSLPTTSGIVYNMFPACPYPHVQNPAFHGSVDVPQVAQKAFDPQAATVSESANVSRPTPAPVPPAGNTNTPTTSNSNQNLENNVTSAASMPAILNAAGQLEFSPSTNNALCCCTTVHGHPHMPPNLLAASSARLRLPPISTILGGTFADPTFLAAAAAAAVPHYAHATTGSATDASNTSNGNSNPAVPAGFLSGYSPLSYAYFVAKANELALANQRQSSEAAEQPSSKNNTSGANPPSSNNQEVTSAPVPAAPIVLPFQQPFYPIVCPGCAQGALPQHIPVPHNTEFAQYQPSSRDLQNHPTVDESRLSSVAPPASNTLNHANGNQAENAPESSTSQSNDSQGPANTSYPVSVPLPNDAENNHTLSRNPYIPSLNFKDNMSAELSVVATLASNSAQAHPMGQQSDSNYSDHHNNDKRAHVSRRHSTSRKIAQSHTGSSSTSSAANVRYRCTECLQGFSRPSSLKIHTYSHTGERPFVCDYAGCGKAFNVRSNMRRHQRIHGL